MAAQEITSTGLLVVLSCEWGGRRAMTTWAETFWSLVFLYCNARVGRKGVNCRGTTVSCRG